MDTTTLCELERWAQEEFGAADLGDARRTKRLVAMAATLAVWLAGRVTSAFRTDAERLAAYRFLSNEEVSAEAICVAAARATLARCAGMAFIYVPVDGSSLALADPHCTRELGSVGTHSAGARGLEMMNAIAVSPGGVPMGLLAQVWWARDEAAAVVPAKQRGIEEKETIHWMTAIERSRAATAAAGGLRLWFQLDRGGDFRELLEFAQDAPCWVTARAAQDRHVCEPGEGLLWKVMRGRPVLGYLTVHVPQREGRPGRVARLAVRACRLTLRLRDRRTGTKRAATLVAVQAREILRSGDDRVEWMLWTNRLVEGFAAACEVVRGYGMRWRVEEFHKTWKSVCRIEQTLLHTLAAITKLATIAAANAMRIERLKRLSRTEPDLPAEREFSREELDALILMVRPKGFNPGDAATLAVATEWLARLGGYTGPAISGGPPGSMVLGRGLDRLGPAAMVLALERASRSSKK